MGSPQSSRGCRKRCHCGPACFCAATNRLPVTRWRLPCGRIFRGGRPLEPAPRAAARGDGAALLVSDSGCAQWNPAAGCWLDVVEFERLRNQYSANLARLIAQRRGRGELARAMDSAQQALARDPLWEDMARDLNALRYAAGDRAGALQEYRRIERTLSDELGVPPMPETVALFGQIRAAAAANGLPASSRTQGAPHSLSAQLTTFIGRERELAALAA